MRLVQPAAVEVVAEAFDHIHGEVPLRSLREVLAQTGVVGRRLRRDRFDDRHKLAAQLAEERPQRRDLHAVVGDVDQRIGDVLVGREIVGQLAAEVEGLLQQRSHLGEVVRRARLGPDLIRRREVAGELRDERGRHFDGALELAARHADQRGVVRVIRQALFVGSQIVQQPADRRIGELLVRQPAERGRLPCARRPAAGRHVRALIPVQQRVGGVEVVDFEQAGLEFVEFGFHVWLRTATCCVVRIA